MRDPREPPRMFGRKPEPGDIRRWAGGPGLTGSPREHAADSAHLHTNLSVAKETGRALGFQT
jgi:hypothetical protein